MNKLLGVAIIATGFGVFLSACGENSSPTAANAGKGGELVVYSARKEHLVKPLFDRYKELTGVNTRYITDSAEPLLARLQLEGKNTPADILITVDAGNLWHAAETGMLASVESEILEANIPAALQDKQNRWFGESIRARTMVYSTDRVKPEELDSYESLAGEQWKGRLCLRTSKKVYNQSLVATMIAANGAEKTEEIVAGWVNNLALAPFSSDTKAMEAVIAGQCDVTIVNTYYFGRLQAKYGKENKTLPLDVFWANQNDRGVHINISGVGITANAPHPEEAKKFIEWVSQPEAQSIIVGLNQEYPVNSAVAVTPEMKAWGDFNGDSIDVGEAGRLQADAVKLMDRAGYR